MAALATLMVVAFTVWRLIANLRALLKVMAGAADRLLPALTELQLQAAAAADTAAQLQTRTVPGSATASAASVPPVAAPARDHHGERFGSPGPPAAAPQPQS